MTLNNATRIKRTLEGELGLDEKTVMGLWSDFQRYDNLRDCKNCLNAPADLITERFEIMKKYDLDFDEFKFYYQTYRKAKNSVAPGRKESSNGYNGKDNVYRRRVGFSDLKK